MLNLRWIIARDRAEVCRIERLVFRDDGWSDHQLLEALKNRNTIGMVAETDSRALLGYCLYRLLPRAVEIVRLAVHPVDQRQGVGSLIIERMVEKIADPELRRHAVLARIPEDNLPCLLLLQHMGFVATDCVGGVVVMTYSLDPDLCRWKSPAVRHLVGG